MKLSLFTRLFTLLLLGIFVALCILFTPHFAAYLVAHTQGSLPAWTVHAMAGVLAAPCVLILLLALPLSDAVARDAVFTAKTARQLSRIARILFADCILFLGGVVWLFALGELTVSPMLALLNTVGFAIAVLLRVFARYLFRAAILKEEADATL